MTRIVPSSETIDRLATAAPAGHWVSAAPAMRVEAMMAAAARVARMFLMTQVYGSVASELREIVTQQTFIYVSSIQVQSTAQVG
jgi:hypothetical protein